MDKFRPVYLLKQILTIKIQTILDKFEQLMKMIWKCIASKISESVTIFGEWKLKLSKKGKPMTVGSFVKDYLMILWEI